MPELNFDNIDYAEIEHYEHDNDFDSPQAIEESARHGFQGFFLTDCVLIGEVLE